MGSTNRAKTPPGQRIRAFTAAEQVIAAPALSMLRLPAAMLHPLFRRPRKRPTCASHLISSDVALVGETALLRPALRGGAGCGSGPSGDGSTSVQAHP